MMRNFFSPVTDPLVNAAEALSSAVIWALIIFTFIQMAQITAIAVRAYYSLKIIKQVSVVLKEIIVEIKDIKREFKE